MALLVETLHWQRCPECKKAEAWVVCVHEVGRGSTTSIRPFDEYKQLRIGFVSSLFSCRIVATDSKLQVEPRGDDNAPTSRVKVSI